MRFFGGGCVVPRETCPVCGATSAERFLFRASVPVHQNLLFPTAEAARAMKRGTLDMRACHACGFVFNPAFDPDLVDYGPAYENSQDCSPAFNAHLDGLVERLVRGSGVRNGRVVEVGCGKGVFLNKLLAHPENHSDAVGFDPSYLGAERVGRMRFVKDFYGPATAVPADVVVCRHVIEHIPEPLELLRTVRAGVGESGETRVFFETPCVEWILHNRVPWDFFYEHCSLFTAASLALALERAGFAVSAVRHVFGGQYLWAEAVSGRTRSVSDGVDSWRTPSASEGVDYRDRTPSLALGVRQFAAEERNRLALWNALLRELSARGAVFVWGAGAKGVTFCNLADPDASRLAGVIDVNPAKQGKFLPGTGHAIVSPAHAGGAAAVLVLNPNYIAEVRATVEQLGSRAKVIDLMQEATPCGS
jgi:SAM-dependent methyltransferase